MADFGTAVRNLRPGYIAKTTKMRGYLRRHEIGSRSENPNYDGTSSTSQYLYYKYIDGRRVQQSDSFASAVEDSLKPPTTPENRRAEMPSADVVFDLEFVENGEYTDTDSKRVYVFRCYQQGGSETSSGDKRIWCVATGTGTGADGDGDNLPDSPNVDQNYGSWATTSPLLIDAATFEMLVSQDWEYNQQLETDYVASTTSQARW